MARSERDITSPAFTITSYTQDLTLAGTEAGAANIAAVLATVIKELIDQGILSGSVSA